MEFKETLDINEILMDSGFADVSDEIIVEQDCFQPDRSSQSNVHLFSDYTCQTMYNIYTDLEIEQDVDIAMESNYLIDDDSCFMKVPYPVINFDVHTYDESLSQAVPNKKNLKVWLPKISSPESFVFDLEVHNDTEKNIANPEFLDEFHQVPFHEDFDFLEKMHDELSCQNNVSETAGACNFQYDQNKYQEEFNFLNFNKYVIRSENYEANLLKMENLKKKNIVRARGKYHKSLQLKVKKEKDISTNNKKKKNRILNSGTVFECSICHCVLPNQLKLSLHIEQDHFNDRFFNSLNEVPDVIYKCYLCSYSSQNRASLERHTKDHIHKLDAAYLLGGHNMQSDCLIQRFRFDKEEYKCPQCTYSCMVEQSFLMHMQAHANGLMPEKLYSCEICGQDFLLKKEMENHFENHRSENHYCCDICKFHTIQLHKVIQHRRMHTGEKPHLCPFCSYRTARRDNMRLHVRKVHHENNIYSDTFLPKCLLFAKNEYNVM